MKKIYFLVTWVLLLILGTNVKAQSKTGTDYFAGKWNVLISGTPYGDLKRIYVLEKKESSLNGIVQDSTGKEVAKCSKVEVQDNQVTLYYQAMGNDVSVTLVRKDDDHVSGSVLNMFEANGERIK